MKLTKTLAVALEAVGGCIGIAGITIEVILGAHIGFILITSGAVIAALGAMFFAKIPRGGSSG